MIAVDVRHRPGRLSAVIRGLSQPFGVGEVYVNGAANRSKAADLKARGHNPLSIPRGSPVARKVRLTVRTALVTGDAAKVRRALLAAAQELAKWFRLRITSGQLGTNKPATAEIKRYLVWIGRATSAYGVPPPYGVQTGKLVRNILARWRSGR